jgi:hypothetical protein
MSTRIRYIKHGDGGLVSLRTFKDKDGADLQSRIYADGKSGCIMFAQSEVPIIEVKASSPHKVKIKLKKVLEILGVKFESETREKNNKEEEL